MKIYIATFGFAENFGAQLQMFALQRYLRELQHDVYVIRYLPRWVHQPRLPAKSLKGKLRACIVQCFGYVRTIKTSAFHRKHLRFTPLCTCADDVAALPQPDAYFAGSDQIWNPQITHGIDETFFLNFRTTAKKIFYAASAGHDCIEGALKEQIMKRMQGIDAISVREKPLLQVMKECGEDRAQLVLDPVFLVDPNEYRRIMKPVRATGFVLLYIITDGDDCYQLARMLAARYGLTVIQIGKYLRRPGVDKAINWIDPLCFASYIAQADYVVTNSFHGTALSIVFRKQFYVRKIDKLQSRITSLLEQVGLTDRIVYNTETLEIQPINYDAVSPVIDQRIRESKEFITQSLIQ